MFIINYRAKKERFDLDWQLHCFRSYICNNFITDLYYAFSYVASAKKDLGINKTDILAQYDNERTKNNPCSNLGKHSTGVK